MYPSQRRIDFECKKKKKMRKKLFEQQRMLLGIQLQPRRKKEFARDELSNAETQFKLETR